MSIRALRGGAMLYVGLEKAGVYCLEPGAGRWHPLNGDLACLDVMALAVLDPESGALVAGTKKGLFLSARQSGRWSRQAVPLPTEPYVNRLFIAQGGEDLIACTSRRLLRCQVADLLARLLGSIR
jgi:hypothetical protein